MQYYELALSTFLVDSRSEELDSRTLSHTYFSFVDPAIDFFTPRPVVNFIATVDDPAGSALLDLPSLQRKPRIHCMCSCILPELLILPCKYCAQKQ